MASRVGAAEAQLDSLRSAGQWDAVATLWKGWDKTVEGGGAAVSLAHPTAAHVAAYRAAVAADVALQSKRWVEARRHLLRALSALPTYVDALVLLARVNVAMGIWPPDAEATSGKGAKRPGGATRRGRLPGLGLHLPALPFLRRAGDHPTAKDAAHAHQAVVVAGAGGGDGSGPPVDAEAAGLGFDVSDNLELLLRARDAMLDRVEHATQYRLFLRVAGLQELCRLHEEGWAPIASPAPSTHAGYLLSTTATCLLHGVAAVDALWCMLATHVTRKFGAAAAAPPVSLPPPACLPAGGAAAVWMPSTGRWWEGEVAALAPAAALPSAGDGSGDGGGSEPIVFTAAVRGDGPAADSAVVVTVARASVRDGGLEVGTVCDAAPAPLRVHSLFCASDDVRRVVAPQVHVVDTTSHAAVGSHLSLPFHPVGGAASAATAPTLAPARISVPVGGGVGRFPAGGAAAPPVSIARVVPPPGGGPSAAAAGFSDDVTASGGLGKAVVAHVDARCREEAVLCLARLPLFLHRLGDVTAAAVAYRACLHSSGPMGGMVTGAVRDALVEGLMLAEAEVGQVVPLRPPTSEAGGASPTLPAWMWPVVTASMVLPPPTLLLRSAASSPASSAPPTPRHGHRSPTESVASAPAHAGEPTTAGILSIARLGHGAACAAVAWLLSRPDLRAVVRRHRALAAAVQPTVLQAHGRSAEDAGVLAATSRPRHRGAWTLLAAALMARLWSETASAVASARTHLGGRPQRGHGGFALTNDVALTPAAAQHAELVTFGAMTPSSRTDVDGTDGDAAWAPLPPAAVTSCEVPTASRIARVSALVAAVEEAVSLSAEARIAETMKAGAPLAHDGDVAAGGTPDAALPLESVLAEGSGVTVQPGTAAPSAPPSSASTADPASDAAAGALPAAQRANGGGLGAPQLAVTVPDSVLLRQAAVAALVGAAAPAAALKLALRAVATAQADAAVVAHRHHGEGWGLPRFQVQAAVAAWRREHLAACLEVTAIALLAVARGVAAPTLIPTDAGDAVSSAPHGSVQPGYTRRLAARALAALTRALDAVGGAAAAVEPPAAHGGGHHGPSASQPLPDLASLTSDTEADDSDGMRQHTLGDDADDGTAAGSGADEGAVGLAGIAEVDDVLLALDGDAEVSIGSRDGGGGEDGDVDDGAAGSQASNASVGSTVGSGASPAARSVHRGGGEGDSTASVAGSEAQDRADAVPARYAAEPPALSAGAGEEGDATGLTVKHSASSAAGAGAVEAVGDHARPRPPPRPQAGVLFPHAPQWAWHLLYHAALAAWSAGDTDAAGQHAARALQLSASTAASAASVDDATLALPWALCAALAASRADWTTAAALVARGVAAHPTHVLLRLAECRLVHVVHHLAETGAMDAADAASLLCAGDVTHQRVLDMAVDTARAADALAWSMLTASWLGHGPAAAALVQAAANEVPPPTAVKLVASHDVGHRDWRSDVLPCTPHAVQVAVAAHLHTCRVAVGLRELDVAWGAVIACDVLLEACGAPVLAAVARGADAGHASAPRGTVGTGSDSPTFASPAYASPGHVGGGAVSFAAAFDAPTRAGLRMVVPIDAALRADVIASAGEVHQAAGQDGQAEACYAAAVALHPSHVPSLVRLSHQVVAGVLELPGTLAPPAAAPISTSLPPVSDAPVATTAQDAWYKLERAIAYAKSAVQHAPEDAGAWCALARAHAAAGDHIPSAEAAVAAAKAAAAGSRNGEPGCSLLPAHLFPWRVNVWA